MNKITTKQKQVTPSSDYTTLHDEIVFCATSSRNYAIRMALALKRMRDEKYYLTAGYSTFEEYTVAELGIKERQAYNYITIAEKHSEEFLHSNAKLGVTKLLLLAEAPEEKKGDLAEAAESETVRQLKEEIRKAKEDKAKTSQRLLTEQSDHKAQLDEVRKEKAKIQAELDALRKEKTESKKPSEPTTDSRIPELEAELSAKDEEINQLKKRISIEGNATLSEFKIRFTQYQEAAYTLLDLTKKMSQEDAEKCKKALRATLEKLKEELK